MEGSNSSQRVVELLRQQDDLERLPVFIDRIKREKQLVDAQLDSGLREREDKIKDAIKQFHQASKMLEDIKQENRRILDMCCESRHQIAGFDQISRISRVHHNFASTYKMVENLQGMDREIQTIRVLIDEEEDTEGHMEPNLLLVHYKLLNLNNFRDEALAQASRTDTDVRSSLFEHFEPLDQLNNEFETRILDISGNLEYLAQQGQLGLLVRIAKIIDTEEQIDKQAAILQNSGTKHDERVTGKAMQLRYRKIKNFQKRFFDAIEDSIKQDFESGLGHDPEEALDQAQQLVFSRLLRAREQIAICLPPKWDFFKTYAGIVHKNAHSFLKGILDAEPDAATILMLLEWIEEYHARLKEEFDLDWEDFQQQLLDGRESQLVDDYLQLIVTKQKEWMAKLRQDDIKVFCERTGEPEMVEDEYTMPGCTTMLQMLHQQIDVALSSNQGRVMVAVVQEVANSLKTQQAEWKTVVSNEVQKQKATPEQVPGGLLEYLIALSNDFIRHGDFCSNVFARVKSTLPQQHLGPVESTLNRSTEEMGDAAIHCSRGIVDLVKKDIGAPLSKVYETSWYSGSGTGSLIETCREYWDTLGTRSTPACRYWISMQILRVIIKAYIDNARGKGPPFKQEQAIRQLSEDMRAIASLANTMCPMEEYEETEYAPRDMFRLIDKLILQLIAQADSAPGFEQYWEIVMDDFPDVPGSVAEEILGRIDKLDKSSLRQCLSFVRAHSDPQPPRNTVWTFLYEK